MKPLKFNKHLFNGLTDGITLHKYGNSYLCGKMKWLECCSKRSYVTYFFHLFPIVELSVLSYASISPKNIT